MSTVAEDKQETRGEIMPSLERKRAQHYSDATKLETLLRLAANGGNVYKTAKQTGISRQLIYRWSKGEGVPPDVQVALQEKRPELGAVCRDVAEIVLDEISEEDIRKANLFQKGLFSATMIDKWLLLTGQAGTIIEHRGGADDVERAFAVLLRAARDHDPTIPELTVLDRLSEARPEIRPALEPIRQRLLQGENSTDKQG